MRNLYRHSNHPKTKRAIPKSCSNALVLNGWEYEFPGYEESLRKGHRVSIGRGNILEEMAQYNRDKSDSHGIPSRDTTAHIADWNLWCLSQAEASLDLLMGEVLSEFNENRLNRLGYVKLGDFVREELGISERAGYELIRNAKALKHYPLLKEAFLKRVLNKSSLRYILKVVTPEREKQWIDAASNLTVKKLHDLVEEWKAFKIGDYAACREFFKTRRRTESAREMAIQSPRR